MGVLKKGGMNMRNATRQNCFTIWAASFVCAFWAWTVCCVAVAEEKSFEERRARMVRKDLVAQSWSRTGVKDKAVLKAMGTVRRHELVPEYLRNRAYEDSPLPIGYGQTISQPYIVASMTELLKVDGDDLVLEIGTGSGYQAAVLAEIVKQVYTIEIVRELGEKARKSLTSLGYANIKTKIGDGYFGWPDAGPFDAIVVTAAASHIPPPLIEQLKPGGRMVIPVGAPLQVQQLMVLEKRQDGSVVKRSVMPVRFVPFTRAAKEK